MSLADVLERYWLLSGSSPQRDPGLLVYKSLKTNEHNYSISERKETTMYGYLIARESAPKPPIKYDGMAAVSYSSTSPHRLDLILWYTSGFL